MPAEMFRVLSDPLCKLCPPCGGSIHVEPAFHEPPDLFTGEDHVANNGTNHFSQCQAQGRWDADNKSYFADREKGVGER